MSHSRPPYSLSRRSLVQTAVAGSVSLSILAASGREISAQDATMAATPDGNYVPQTGIERDELIIGVQGLPDSLDPAMALSNVGSRVVWTPYDTLIRRDFLNDNVHVPMLAKSWTQISDTELELNLRDDVTFHNGDPFTADDVVFTFERLFSGDDPDVVEAASYFSTFEKVEKVADHVVRITTTAPDPVIINRLASWGAWIVPKKYIEEVGIDEFRRTGMGTGPLKFVSFTPDTEIVLERYDECWDALPPVKRVVFRVIPEVAARVTALANNEVQLITNVPPDQAASLAENPDVDVREVILSNTHVLVYNTNNAPFDNKLVRQALNLGIDRELIIEAIWGGKARAKRSHQFEEYGALYNPDRPLTPYDPERAKALLAEAGYNGELVQYQTAAGYYTNTEQVGQAIVQMWQEIGVNAEILISEGSKSGEERMCHTWSNSSVLADPDGCLWRSWGAESSTQAQYWTAPDEFNALGVEARTTMDTQTRFDNYQAMLDIWEDEAPGTVLYDPTEFYGVSKSVNWLPYPMYNMDLRAYNLSFNE